MDLNTTEIFNFIQDNHLSDITGVLGFFITLIGFAFTIYNLFKTRKASEIAALAVNNIRSDLKKVDTISRLSSILTELDEIKRLHREKKHGELINKYSKLRTSLIFIKHEDNTLKEDEKIALQSIIVHLSSCEKALEKALDENNYSIIKTTRFNNLNSQHIDKLQQILIRVKSTIGDNL